MTPIDPASGAGARAPLTRQAVAHVAKLARLHLSDDELGTFTRQLSQVLDHADDVSSLDLDGVAPTGHAMAVTNVLRGDLPQPSLNRQEVLDAAPQVEDHRFRVPPILGEAP